MAAADDDEFHTSGNLVRGKYNDYQVGNKMGLNRGPQFSEVLARMWGRAPDQDEPNADVLKAAAMKTLTSGQMAKRNEQKSASAYGAKVVPNGPGF